MVNLMIPPEIPIAKGLVEIPKYDAITKRNRTANYATTEFSAETGQNQETTANRIVYSAQQYEKEMNVAIESQAGAQIAGVNAGAGQAIGGYQRGRRERRSTRRSSTCPEPQTQSVQAQSHAKCPKSAYGQPGREPLGRSPTAVSAASFKHHARFVRSTSNSFAALSSAVGL